MSVIAGRKKTGTGDPQLLCGRPVNDNGHSASGGLLVALPMERCRYGIHGDVRMKCNGNRFSSHGIPALLRFNVQEFDQLLP